MAAAAEVPRWWTVPVASADVAASAAENDDAVGSRSNDASNGAVANDELRLTAAESKYWGTAVSDVEWPDTDDELVFGSSGADCYGTQKQTHSNRDVSAGMSSSHCAPAPVGPAVVFMPVIYMPTTSLPAVPYHDQCSPEQKRAYDAQSAQQEWRDIYARQERQRVYDTDVTYAQTYGSERNRDEHRANKTAYAPWPPEADLAAPHSCKSFALNGLEASGESERSSGPTLLPISVPAVQLEPPPWRGSDLDVEREEQLSHGGRQPQGVPATSAAPVCSDAPSASPADSTRSRADGVQVPPALPASSRVLEASTAPPGNFVGGYLGEPSSSWAPPGVLNAAPASTRDARGFDVPPDRAAIDAMLASSSITIEVIDNPARCLSVCNDLLEEQSGVAVDFEGVELDRHGPLCFAQVALRDGRVFLFDIFSMGRCAFDHGLKQVLESEMVPKLLFDCRCDADALYHQFGIQLCNILDLQVLLCSCDELRRSKKWLIGLTKALGEMLSNHEFGIVEHIKHYGHKLYEPQCGGSGEIWKQRPLPHILMTYCALDVGHLFTMFEKWQHCLPIHVLQHASEARAFTQITRGYEKHGAEKDFVIDLTLGESASRDQLFEMRAVLKNMNLSGTPPALRREESHASGIQCWTWDIAEKLLRSRDKSITQPPFEIEIGGCVVEFKIILNAIKALGQGRGVGSFERSKGRGTFTLKCFNGVDQVSVCGLTFRFFVGKGAKRVYSRRIEEHDFASNTCAALREDEACDLAAAVEDGVVQVGVEVIPATSYYQ